VIDFRYHLVSLISVFLALAVGIVLGAGPLKQPIGESLQNQVEDLRTDRDHLRDELDTAHGDIDKLNAFVVAEAPTLLSGALKNRTISLVHSADADGEQLKDLKKRLDEAGAKTVDGGGLAEQTFAADGRADFVTKLRSIDSKLPKNEEAAITAALSKAWAVDRGQQAYTPQLASDVLDAFKSAGRIKSPTAQKTDGVIFVAGAQSGMQAGQAGQPTPTAGAADSSAEALAKLLGEVSVRIPTVAAGTSGNAASGLISQLRSADADVTTTDGIELGAGPVIAVLAMKERLSTGKNQAFGFGEGTQSLVPGVEQK